MNKTSKIYVAGHTGLVGSALMRVLKEKGYPNIIVRTYEELDLTSQASTEEFFRNERPEYVFLAAALVGGIMANNTYRADFIYTNIMIQSNVIHACWKYGVRKLLFLGSTCIYPKNAPQPLKEEYLLTSRLEYTNEPYAIAKIAGLKMCEAFNIQYNTDFIAVMPTNLYGPGDNYDLERSHVLPGLLRKMHLAKCLEQGDWESIRGDLDRRPVEGLDGRAEREEIIKVLDKYGIQKGDDSAATVHVLGTGNPVREFMHSEDMASACLYLMEKISVSNIVGLYGKRDDPEFRPPQFINIGTGEEISVRDLAERLKTLTGFRGRIGFDTSKPDGTMRKATDSSMLTRLGFRPQYRLETGLEETYTRYLE